MVRTAGLRVGLLCALLMTCSSALADGGFVGKEGTDLKEPEQKAIIYWHKGKQVLLLQVKYKGATDDFAWIIPTPTKPDVSVIPEKKSPFKEITKFCDDREDEGYFGEDDDDDVWGDDGGGESVRVVEQKTVGVFDVAVLKAVDGDSLAKWLKKNGYSFPEKHAGVLDFYAKKKWYYVATRITSDELKKKDTRRKLKSGKLQPLRLAFDSKQMTYPLHISSINEGISHLLLYLISDTTMVYGSGPKGSGFATHTQVPDDGSKAARDKRLGTYAKVKAAKDLPLTAKALGKGALGEFFVSRYSVHCATEKMTDDLVFEEFNPIAYWKTALSYRPKSAYGKREHKRAVSILRHYAKQSLVTLAASKSPHQRSLGAAFIKKDSPKELVAQLAEDKDPRVRRAMARNRSVPFKHLEAYMRDEDQSVRDAVLTNDSLWRGLDLDAKRRLVINTKVLARLLSLSDPPPAALEAFTELGGYTGKLTLAQSKSVPPQILVKLLSEKALAIRLAATTTLSMVSSQRPDKEWRRSRLKKELPGYLAKSKTSLSDLLKTMSEDTYTQIRRLSAAHWRTPTASLDKLSRDFDDEVKRLVAANPSTSPKTLAQLSKSKDTKVIQSIAAHRGTPPTALATLASHTDAGVRTGIAGNIKTPTTSLPGLVADKDAKVRIAIATNPRLTQLQLKALVSDKDASVREAVAANWRITRALLMQLTKDNDKAVVDAAREALKKK